MYYQVDVSAHISFYSHHQTFGNELLIRDDVFGDFSLTVLLLCIWGDMVCNFVAATMLFSVRVHLGLVWVSLL